MKSRNNCRCTRLTGLLAMIGHAGHAGKIPLDDDNGLKLKQIVV